MIIGDQEYEKSYIFGLALLIFMKKWFYVAGVVAVEMNDL